MPVQLDEHQRLEIDWVRIVAGALAAVASAVLLSTLGAAGTIIGAALGSVIFSVGTSVFSTGLVRSRMQVAKYQAAALQKVGVAQAEVRRASRRRGSQTAVEGHLEHAEEQLVEAQAQLDEIAEAEEATSWKQRLATLPWKKVALVSVGLFVVAVVAITIFELAAGRPVSSFTGGTSSNSGGTSFTDMGGGGGRSTPSTPRHTGGATPTQGPTQGSSPTQAPTDNTTPTQEPTQTPTEQPTSQPTATPTEAPTPTATAPAPQDQGSPAAGTG